ncbi:MAG: type II toxin-antitoxin system VapC family toxin [Deltaproteobacteria bacterium]|nr:type II toxin-antitoxin system VapC family toxin [Deltaproteobacteria bacterium]
MSLYVDTSALLKRYVAEDDSEACERFLLGDLSWITARHTWVEVVRNLSRLLSGAERARVKTIFRSDWSRMHVVEIDATLCERAGDLAETLQVRTLDALHFAAAERAGAGGLPYLTYDIRQAQVARSLGWSVLGR